jgi:2-keto-4-pentenoate hydratase/2-oxohepta-3-ene-1,7-dioic acid hydratase in catechol pathway
MILSAGQVVKTSGSTTCNVDIWLSQNGEYIANSNTRSSVNAVNDTIVLMSQAIMPLKANDVINTVMSVSATSQGCGLINTAPPSEPNIPAIIFSLVRIGT